MSNISQNIQKIRQHIPAGVTLLCVSKFQPIELLREAYCAGERDFGESRVQELVEKQAVLPKDIRWHFIGHLQTNKVKYIIPFVHLIHSVDSVKLLQTIEKEATKAGRIVDVLLEVHVAREETKTGFSPDELPSDFSAYPHIRVRGIMGMATNTDNETEIRRCFRQIKAAGDSLRIDKPIISMGMSGDYQTAIEEGSTMVRIGSYIFGERHYATASPTDNQSVRSSALKTVLAFLLVFFFETVLPLSAREARIYGYVLDEKNVGIELANVYLDDGVTGTATNRNGYYSLTVPMNDTVTVVFSMLGYKTLSQQIYTDRDVLNINVVLPEDNAILEEVEVRGLQRQTGMMETTDATVSRLMPDATGGSIESLLITFAGVSQNNELSTQYNVRGGSYDENSVYVNGLEIHRPLLIRSGQQEGLSFVNPNMVDRLEFSAGGFNAQYGDKMASVLDIQYKRPKRLESSLSVSLLGANAYIGWGDSTQSQMHGIRYKTSKYMLGALPTKGNYQPTFVDYQTYMTWATGKQTEKKKWEMNFLGNFSLNNYSFIPDSESEGFGTYTQALNKTIWYQGQEKDRFLTALAAVSAKGEYQLNSTDRLNVHFTLGGFYTREQETYDILGEYVLSEQSLDGSSSNAKPEGETISGDVTEQGILGTGNSHEHARNSLQAGVVTLSHRGDWRRHNQLVSWGLQLQTEIINDRISEWEWRDSAGYSMPTATDKMELLYSLKGTNRMATLRTEGFVQDEYKWHTDMGSVTLNGGVRFNFWSFNRELLVSPRANVVWMPGWKRDFTFRFATGLYYQSPFYKELRDTVTTDGVTRIKLNEDLKAQRSVHALLGADYYFRAWGRPFKFTTELYGKYIDRMVSYSVDNVRVRYSGKNDSYGYTLGADFKLYGELVPGVDSWVSLSLMRSRMHLNEDSLGLGWIPTPQEQRWAVTFFFQDYIPRLPQYRLHLKFVFSDGLPFGYPRSASMRYLGRLSAYKRIDLGLSRTFSASTDRFMHSDAAKHIASWSIYFEVFNVVGWKNVNSYYWLTAADGTQWASPNYLTGRMYNLRLSIDLQ